jgi:hypothetical protein
VVSSTIGPSTFGRPAAIDRSMRSRRRSSNLLNTHTAAANSPTEIAARLLVEGMASESPDHLGAPKSADMTTPALLVKVTFHT